MTDSSDENTTYEDLFNSYMSTQRAHCRQYINTLESNKTKSDYDTNDKSLNKPSTKKIRRKSKKTKKKLLK